MLSMSSDVNDPGARLVTFDQVYQAYREQVIALHEGGVDLFLIETITDTLNCKAAIKAIMDLEAEGLEHLPIWISGTITDRSGRTLSGQTAEAFWNSVKHAKPFAIGFNCALGAELMRPHIAELARVADTLVAAYPNAGLPNAFGEYDETPDQTGGHMLHEWAEGRPGQRPGRMLRYDPGPHQRHVAEAVAGLTPRVQIPEPVRRPCGRGRAWKPVRARPDEHGPRNGADGGGIRGGSHRTLRPCAQSRPRTRPCMRLRWRTSFAQVGRPSPVVSDREPGWGGARRGAGDVPGARSATTCPHRRQLRWSIPIYEFAMTSEHAHGAYGSPARDDAHRYSTRAVVAPCAAGAPAMPALDRPSRVAGEAPPIPLSPSSGWGLCRSLGCAVASRRRDPWAWGRGRTRAASLLGRGARRPVRQACANARDGS